MKTLIINIDKDSSLKKLVELAKKLQLKTKVVIAKKEDAEHDEWMRLTAETFAKSYANDEPDISHLTIKEPNPNYKPLQHR